MSQLCFLPKLVGSKTRFNKWLQTKIMNFHFYSLISCHTFVMRLTHHTRAWLKWSYFIPSIQSCNYSSVTISGINRRTHLPTPHCWHMKHVREHDMLFQSIKYLSDRVAILAWAYDGESLAREAKLLLLTLAVHIRECHTRDPLSNLKLSRRVSHGLAKLKL